MAATQYIITNRKTKQVEGGFTAEDLEAEGIEATEYIIEIACDECGNEFPEPSNGHMGIYDGMCFACASEAFAADKAGV